MESKTPGVADEVPDSDHFLHLKGHPIYDWELVCNHPASEWTTLNDDGVTFTEECWLQSWWDNEGTELLSDKPEHWPEIHRVPIPVKLAEGSVDYPVLIYGGRDK